MQRAGVTAAWLVGAVMLALGATACGSVTAEETGEFVIKVDSITGPNAVSGGASFQSWFWGTVGPNSCYRFKELRTTRTPSQVDVTVVGDRTAGDACYEAIVPLNGMPLRIEPLIPYDFMIVVHQPDGTTLKRRVYGE